MDRGRRGAVLTAGPLLWVCCRPALPLCTRADSQRAGPAHRPPRRKQMHFGRSRLRLNLASAAARRARLDGAQLISPLDCSTGGNDGDASPSPRLFRDAGAKNIGPRTASAGASAWEPPPKGARFCAFSIILTAPRQDRRVSPSCSIPRIFASLRGLNLVKACRRPPCGIHCPPRSAPACGPIAFDSLACAAPAAKGALPAAEFAGGRVGWDPSAPQRPPRLLLLPRGSCLHGRNRLIACAEQCSGAAERSWGGSRAASSWRHGHLESPRCWQRALSGLGWVCRRLRRGSSRASAPDSGALAGAGGPPGDGCEQHGRVPCQDEVRLAGGWPPPPLFIGWVHVPQAGDSFMGASTGVWSRGCAGAHPSWMMRSRCARTSGLWDFLGAERWLHTCCEAGDENLKRCILSMKAPVLA